MFAAKIYHVPKVVLFQKDKLGYEREV